MKKNFCLSSFVLFLVSVGFGRGFQDLELQPQKVSISRKFLLETKIRVFSIWSAF